MIFYLPIHNLRGLLSMASEGEVMRYTVYTQKNCAVSKVNKQFISHLTLGTMYT